MHYVVPFIDILYPKEEDNRSGEERVADIAERAGLTIIEE